MTLVSSSFDFVGIISLDGPDESEVIVVLFHSQKTWELSAIKGERKELLKE